MQGIVRCKHEQFLKMINDLKNTGVSVGEELKQLEAELEDSFERYVRKIDDLKINILEYRMKEKILRIKMRELTLKKQHSIY